jgi:hypothetical protein
MERIRKIRLGLGWWLILQGSRLIGPYVSQDVRNAIACAGLAYLKVPNPK